MIGKGTESDFRGPHEMKDGGSVHRESKSVAGLLKISYRAKGIGSCIGRLLPSVS